MSPVERLTAAAIIIRDAVEEQDAKRAASGVEFAHFEQRTERAA